MEKYIGKSVYKGTAIGPINVLKKSDGIVKRQHVEDVAAELQRLEDAKKQAQAQLGALYEKALQEVGEVNAQIFEVHQMMLEDEDYQDAIHSMIETEELNAEYAVAVTGDNFAEIFANMDDEYMQARSADVKDISNRLIRNLSGEEELDWAHMEPSIIVADDLTPSETVQMDKRKILAFRHRPWLDELPYRDPRAYDEHPGADRCAGGARQSPFRYDVHRRWQGCRVLRGSG